MRNTIPNSEDSVEDLVDLLYVFSGGLHAGVTAQSLGLNAMECEHNLLR